MLAERVGLLQLGDLVHMPEREGRHHDDVVARPAARRLDARRLLEEP